jgi:hypothetical protein
VMTDLGRPESRVDADKQDTQAWPHIVWEVTPCSHDDWAPPVGSLRRFSQASTILPQDIA